MGRNHTVTKSTIRVVQSELQPADYLLGQEKHSRYGKTTGPHHEDFWPGISKGTKICNVQYQGQPLNGKNTEFIKSVKDIKELKKSNGSDLQVLG